MIGLSVKYFLIFFLVHYQIFISKINTHNLNSKNKLTINLQCLTLKYYNPYLMKDRKSLDKH